MAAANSTGRRHGAVLSNSGQTLWCVLWSVDLLRPCKQCVGARQLSFEIEIPDGFLQDVSSKASRSILAALDAWKEPCTESIRGSLTKLRYVEGIEDH